MPKESAEVRLHNALSTIPSLLLLAAAGFALRALGPGRDFRIGMRTALSFTVVASAAPYAAHALQCLRVAVMGA